MHVAVYLPLLPPPLLSPPGAQAATCTGAIFPPVGFGHSCIRHDVRPCPGAGGRRTAMRVAARRPFCVGRPSPAV